MRQLARILPFLLAASAARAAVVAAPGYLVRSIPAPGTVEGGVAHRDGVILVGQGPGFTAGAQSIVRLDAGGPTTIATGFNSLGGIDLDPAGTLYAVDNCLQSDGDHCGTTATGDTLYAIPDALTRADAAVAKDHKAAPDGTFPNAQDTVALSGGAALVSDARGPGAGRVLRVAGGAATDLPTPITGLNVQGLALAPDGTLLVGLLDDMFMFGEVRRYGLDGTLLGTVAMHLQGEFDQVVDDEANVLVSGVHTPDFSDGMVVAVSPGGAVSEVAHGFAFSSAIDFDAGRDEALVLDFGATAVTALCRDANGDGVCDLCPGAAMTAVRVGLDKLGTPEADDKLLFKGQMTIPTSPPLDPIASGVRVMLEDRGGPVLDATIPGGAVDALTKIGWTGKKGTFRYQDAGGAVAGIVNVLLKTTPKKPGLVTVLVQGKRGRYALDPAQLPLRAAVVLDPRAGQCGAATPACAYDAKHGKLRCK